MVDSDDGMKDEELEESGNETDDDDYDEFQDEGDAEYIIGIEQEPANRLKADDEYTFEVLTAGEVVGLIQEIIRDVNTVVQVQLQYYKILFITEALMILTVSWVFVQLQTAVLLFF